VTRKQRLFLESRYRKLVRDLPQTIFYCPDCKGDRRRRRNCARCDGRGKLADDSVQELLGRRLLPAYRAKSGKFHGAGREDVDVLMLGRGRPFVFEVVGPKRLDLDLDALLERFHAEEGHRVQCAPFRLVDRRRVAELKNAHFEKVYRVVVDVGAGPGAEPGQEVVRGLLGRADEVRQRTPQRVAHRRADLVRERRVTIEHARLCADGLLEIDARTSHGTYVKEWVSGDGGRTEPSLSDLLGRPARCVRLDVLEIVTDGPTNGVVFGEGI
jgi:tRNA pseudouridine synthase 10